MRSRTGNKAVFVDRDGVINNVPNGKYLLSEDEVSLVPLVKEAIADFHRKGYKVIIITNQQCIGKKQLTWKGLEKIHMKVQGLLEKEVIDAIYCCPHLKSENCGCRKPKPGMILKAAGEHEIDLGCSYFVGDAESDIEAARSAGVRPILLTHSLELALSYNDIPVFEDFTGIMQLVK